jgi:succinate-semialdehyde dehydrogenase/glutarate-semialdehyde dehydrogenase
MPPSSCLMTPTSMPPWKVRSQSKYRNAGQTCVCTNRFYVQAGMHDAFVERLAERVAALQRRARPMPKGVQVGPLIDAAGAGQGASAHVDDAVAQGAQSGRGRSGAGRPGPGLTTSPTLLTGVTGAHEASAARRPSARWLRC